MAKNPWKTYQAEVHILMDRSHADTCIVRAKNIKKAYDEVVKMMSKKHKTEYITVDSIKEISI